MAEKWRWMAVLTVFLGGCGLISGAGRRVPPGWRLPTPAEAAQSWRDDRPHRYLRARADFTGDGLADEVAFLVETPIERLVLVLVETQKTGPSAIHLLDDLGDLALLDAAGIDVVGPGTHRVMCDESGTACADPGGTRALDLQTPAIVYFKPESARRLFYWNPSRQEVDQAWTSD